MCQGTFLNLRHIIGDIMKLLTQVEVLKEINIFSKTLITRSSFTKRVKKGQIKFHYKTNSKKKFYKLHEVAKVYGIKIDEIDSSTPSDIKDNEDLFNPENLSELNKLLLDADTPMIKVSVIDTFWAGKIKELKFKQLYREVIPMDEALYVYQITGTRLKSKIYEIAHQVKAQFPEASDDLIDFLHLKIDKAFDEFTKDTETL